MTLLAHLHGNAVAYAALAVALTSGTAYAADRASIPNGSVTTKKLANNAVTSAKIKPGTITRSDLARGTLPRGTQLFAKGLETGTPTITPELTSETTTLNVDRDSTALITFSADKFGVTCNVGTSQAAIYVDGDATAMPDVLTGPADDLRSLTLVVATELDAGEHVLTVGTTCIQGTPTAGPTRNGTSWTAVLVPQ